MFKNKTESSYVENSYHKYTANNRYTLPQGGLRHTAKLMSHPNMQKRNRKINAKSTNYKYFHCVFTHISPIVLQNEDILLIFNIL